MSSIEVNQRTASQLDRVLPALRNGFVEVDGRSFAEVLNFAVEFGRLVNFYDLDNKRSGDWVEFFAADVTITIGSILATDLRAVRNRFESLRRTIETTSPWEKKVELLRAAFGMIMDLARRVDVWFVGLGSAEREPGADLLLSDLRAAIETRLGPLLRTLRSYDKGAQPRQALDERIGLHYDGLNEIWGLNDVGPDPGIYCGDDRGQRVNHALSYLLAIMDSVSHVVVDLQSRAKTAFELSYETGTHRPQAALYIAFARLFETAQDTANTIGQRYERFYYDEILRGQTNGPAADSLYLALTGAEDAADSGTSRTVLSHGELFSAGTTPDGTPIDYALDRDVTLTPARFARLGAVRVIRGSPTTQPAKTESSGDYTQRVFATAISAPDGSAVSEAQWATFGRTEAGAGDTFATRLATLGFAVSSSCLALSGGSRKIRLSVDYDPDSFDDELSVLLKISAKGKKTGKSKRKLSALLASVLHQAFEVHLSMSDGWFHVPQDDYNVTVDRRASQFIFEISLDASVPAISACELTPDAADAELDGVLGASANPNPSLPTLKMYLRQEAVEVGQGQNEFQIYPLALLSDLAVDSIKIRAEVTGLIPTALETSDGQMDPSTPFPVLGSQPALGSYLRVFQPEMFCKNIDLFSLSIDWFGLPPNDDGLFGWYRAYTTGLDGRISPKTLFGNDTFTASFSIQNAGLWDLSPDVQSDYLFRSGEHLGVDHANEGTNSDGPSSDPNRASRPRERGPLSQSTTFSFSTIGPTTPSARYEPSTGAVELQLSGPKYAFGADLYAQNVLASVRGKMPNLSAHKVQCAKANSPITELATCMKSLATDGARVQLVDAVLECASKFGYNVVRQLESCVDDRTPDHNSEDSLVGLRKQVNRLEQRSTVSTKRNGATELEGMKRELTRLVDVHASNGCEHCSNAAGSYAETVAVVMSWLNDVQPAGLKKSLGRITNIASNFEAQCVQTLLQSPVEAPYPNDPVVPFTERVSVDYVASASALHRESSETTESACFYHLLPFCGFEQRPATSAASMFLLPQFEQEGSLYVGISGLIEKQVLPVLIQMAMPTSSSASQTVRWDYLAANQWLPLTKHLDQTNGLNNTGIVELEIPKSVRANATVLTPDLTWIRASVSDNADAFPCMQAIYGHGATATRTLDASSGAALAAPLAAASVTGPANRDLDLASVLQPLPSFGGRAPEDNATLRLRLSEQLRHKDRTSLGWDIERQVLQRFPAICKVGVLPARDRDGPAPGHTLVVVVPRTDHESVMDQTTPRLPGDELDRVAATLAATASPFARFDVVNPAYVKVKVHANVEFASGQATSDLVNRLNADLVDYLLPGSPTATSASDCSFASELDISYFIETRPYVTSLSHLELIDQPERSSLPWYFLTSADQHTITTGQSNIDLARPSALMGKG